MKSKYKNSLGKRIEQWSYSRYVAYDKCPFMAKCKFIDKIKEPTGYAMEKGNKSHALAESFVQGKIFGMPKELSKFRKEFLTLKSMRKLGIKIYTEIDLAIALGKKNWVPSAYDDWSNVWCRGKADLLVIEDPDLATDVDYKTGKKYDSHAMQGELYAIQTMVHFPAVKKVDVEFWYLDLGEVEGDTFHRKNLKKLQLKWEKKVKPMLTDTKFKPCPDYYCKWCSFAKDKGGQCSESSE